MRNRAVRGCLILLPLLVSAATLAKSNDPSPSPPEIRKPEQPKPGEPETPAQKNQDRTAISPLIIKEAPAPKAQKEPAENTKETDSKTSTDWWMVWLTGILAFVASLQLVVFGLQARRLRQTIETMKKIGADQSRDMQASIAVAKESADAARDSIQLAGDTAKRQLRAYIHVDDVKMCYMRSEFNPNIQIIIKNFGGTPAHDVTNTCECQAIITQGDKRFALDKTEAQEIEDLGPTQVTYSTFIYPLGQWETDLLDLADKTKTFYVFGRIDYIDAFNERRCTEFRHRLLVDTDGIKDEASLVRDGSEGNKST